MHRRFLNNEDYLSILTEEWLGQLIRERESRLWEAEEAAEQSVIEYLTENYMVEEELEVGRRLIPHNPLITYPPGAHFLLDGKMVKATRTISGLKSPARTPYWAEDDGSDRREPLPDPDRMPSYTQTGSYIPGDRVRFGRTVWRCLEYNGLDYGDIRVPGVDAWREVGEETRDGFVVPEWEPNVEYRPWDVVRFGGHFYTLVCLPEDVKPEKQKENEESEKEAVEGAAAQEGGGGARPGNGDGDGDAGEDGDPGDAGHAAGWAQNPLEGPHWGMIADYDPECMEYANDPHEYVVYDGRVFRPVMNPVPDVPEMGVNVVEHDPRNPNLKKHILRLAVYELFKLVSPTNISQSRVTDYETSMQWLRDAGRMRITPGIPRRLGRDEKPVTDFVVATFASRYDPSENPWHI